MQLAARLSMKRHHHPKGGAPREIEGWIKTAAKRDGSGPGAIQDLSRPTPEILQHIYPIGRNNVNFVIQDAHFPLRTQRRGEIRGDGHRPKRSMQSRA